MKTSNNLFLIAILAFLLGAACSEKDPDQEPELPEEPEMPINPYDTASIDWVLNNILNYIPTWEELEKFTDTATYLPMPDFQKRAANYALETGNGYGDDYIGGLLADINQLVDFYGANQSGSSFNDMPPFYLENEEFIVPYPLDRLDQKLRAITVLYLAEKAKGRTTLLINFYPPFVDFPTFTSQQEFETWFVNRYLPEKAAEARAAELMKAEQYVAWPLEMEVFVYSIGGIGNGGFMEGKTSEEILEVANDIKTRIFQTVRPLYNGRLVAHIHNNYYQRPEEHFWDQMSYAEFDELFFAFFPPFDLETAEAYMDEQLIHYTKVIENSGNLPWVASEVSVFEWYVQDGMFQAFEKDLYEVAFTKLESAPIPPSGISAAAGYMQTQAAKDYLKQFFATR